MGRNRVTSSAEETITLGALLGRHLRAGQVVCLYGDLAAGKTTFVKGIVQGVAGRSPDEVVSPTFVFLNIYPGNLTVYHFDLYRLRSPEEFASLGFDEYLAAGGVCCIEWSERLGSQMPQGALGVELRHMGANKRWIEWSDETLSL